MTEQTQQPTSPFAMPLGLCNPLWPAYGLMMGASLQWWALSRMARFASPMWAFETKPKVADTVQAPLPVIAPAEATPVAGPKAHVQAAAVAEPDLTPTVEAAFAPELETFMAPDVAPEPQVEPTSEAEAASAPETTLGPGDVDELTLIRGIGPRVADALVERGVTTFRQLAEWTEKDMHHFDTELKLLGRSKRYDFLGQAKALASQA